MKLNEAILEVARYYVDKKERPTHCDVRCMINDLIDQSYDRKGYNQDIAYKKVMTIINWQLQEV